jgi:pimeloyl-ACP methyl ester carboxylesterase
MPFVRNAGIRIHYEVVGEGTPLVLVHGFTDSPMVWRERGYVGALATNHKLILISLRGHHLSDKPHQQDAYKTAAYVSDTLVVLDAIGIPKTHFFGYSLGGWVGFALLRDAPDRLGAVVLGGAGPVAFPPEFPDPYMPVLLQGAPALLSFYEPFCSPGLRTRLLASDMDALIPCRRARFESPGFEDALANVQTPTLLFCGEQDPVHSAASDASVRMPSAEFFSVPGSKHIQCLYESERVLPRIESFFARHDKLFV